MSRPIALLALLSACTGATPDPVDETWEWTTDVPGALAFRTPVYEVPPFSDQTMCAYASYDGGDVAVSWAGFQQHEAYGHHVILMTTKVDADDWPDGTTVDCGEASSEVMVDSRPFLFAGDVSGEHPEMRLPEGMAVKLKAGTRFIIQSHHINFTDAPLLLNDAVFIETGPLEDVQTFAAPWVNNTTNFSIPPGEDLAVEIDCTFEDDLHLLSAVGHMHEWGTSFSVDHVRAEGDTTRLYDIPTWDVQYRDAPPVTVFGLGEYPVKAGDRFVTRCAWHNDTEAALGFPHEMCAAVGFAYPLVVPMICDR